MSYDCSSMGSSYNPLGESPLGFEDSYSVRNSSFYKGLDPIEKNFGYESSVGDHSTGIPRLKQLS